ncbi:MAG: metal-dependent transcriptional regulator [Thermoplasmata archaeon]|nr:metal-dependent transcriptional regulator [Thermoplasmata archaeon]
MRRITKEEYIETIFALQKDSVKVQTGQIAQRMDVKPPSVTEMLGKLQDEGLVNYEPYIGAELTSKGEKLARELLETHKVISDFLEILGIDKDVAEHDACIIEHHMSRESAQRLKMFVEFIQTAPKDPKWIENFLMYCETGKRECRPED